MKILYGVQTTGNGHISRSTEVVHYLKELGADVQVIFSGAQRSSFWDYSVFEPYDVYKGVTFVTAKGRISLRKTAIQINPADLVRDIRQLDVSSYDLVVSDFEPITAWAAKLRKKPSVGISHQNAFYYRIPRPLGGYLARLVMRTFAPTTIKIGLHWHHFNHPILPPIVNPDLISAESIAEDKILVYLPFEDARIVRELLRPFDTRQFYIYEGAEKEIIEGHIYRLPFSREGFMRDLQDCAGVICQAGFELPSEALHIGKKLLVKPVSGQYEQISNGIALEKLGLGTSISSLSASSVANWLQEVSNNPMDYPNVAKALAEWIVQDDLSNPQSLASSLWKRVGSLSSPLIAE